MGLREDIGVSRPIIKSQTQTQNPYQIMTHKITFKEVGLTAIIPTGTIRRKAISDIPQMLNDAAAENDYGNLYMRLFYILSALGQDDLALEMQSKALEHRSVYRVANPSNPKIRLLAIMGPGDMTDNTPLDFLVEESDIRLDLLFISSGIEPPILIPDHDIAFVALGESTKNNPILKKIEKLLCNWARPYINHPNDILNCARHKTSQQLQHIPGLLVPLTYRKRREQVVESTFPITIRPIDTHAGKGLEKINNSKELDRYLTNHPEIDEFYISEFIDYQSNDGNYRKFRIALIDRKPFICHLAISESWIAHYLSSEMHLSELKRAEEKSVMESFDNDFAVRHADALFAIADRLKLEYVVIDCSETKEGELLLFEADPGGWIHATDPIESFPYKPAVMQKAFDAFRSLLLKRFVIE